MDFNPFLTDTKPLQDAKHHSEDSMQNYFAGANLLDDSSDVSSTDIPYLDMSWLHGVETTDLALDLPFFDDPFSFEKKDNLSAYGMTYLSPLALSVRSKISEVDADEVCHGHFPSFVMPYSKEETRSSGENSIVLPSIDWNITSTGNTEFSFTNELYQSIPNDTQQTLPQNPSNSFSNIHSWPSRDDSELSHMHLDMTMSFTEQQNKKTNDDDNDDDYAMEEEFTDYKYIEIDSNNLSKDIKTNHTWEETARQLSLPISTSEMINYSIPDQWLSSTDYLSLLQNMEKGHSSYPLYDYGYDSHMVTFHPNFIYMNPCPAIYFLRCENLKNGRPMFGFPRIKNMSKDYTWKKQGFTTAIPKSDPCVRYITANCYLCGKGKNKNSRFAAFAGREPVLRMHAVMKVRTFQTRGNTDKYQNDNYIDEGPFVLVHILKGGNRNGV